MNRNERSRYKNLVANLCTRYAGYHDALNQKDTDKRVFETIKATSDAENALELFALSLKECGLRIALHAMTEGFEDKDIAAVSKEIDEIIRRREELELPSETYKGE